jgi:hypothetical protein
MKKAVMDQVIFVHLKAIWMPFSAPRERTQNYATHGRNAKESQLRGA